MPASVDSTASLAGSVIAVVGPTATGKSALGIALARAVGGEVINADAMQLYRGMDVGTAKLTPGEWGGVPHHLLDVWDVTRTASVAEYQELARGEIDRLHAAGRRAVVVGGSGLYVRAALDRMEFPGTDAGIRARLEDELARVGSYVLHQRLAAIDPAAALVILPSNGRRIVRALEVIELTGKPFRATLPALEPYYDTVYIGLDMEPDALDARVDARVVQMWAHGLVEEVQRLAATGLRDGATASRALGYSQVLRMLDGEIDSDEAIAQTQRSTRRFVRRQRSWFRRESRITWLDSARDDLEAMARRLVMV